MAAAARLRVWAPGALRRQSVPLRKLARLQGCVAARVEGSRDRVVRARMGRWSFSAVASHLCTASTGRRQPAAAEPVMGFQ